MKYQDHATARCESAKSTLWLELSSCAMFGSLVQVYIIDFGLAKKYRDPTTHQHIPYRSADGTPCCLSMLRVYRHVSAWCNHQNR